VTRWLTRLSIPAALVLAVALSSAPQSGAATKNVRFHVDPATTISTACSPASLTLSLDRLGTPSRGAGTCDITFGVGNSPNGARLDVQDGNTGIAMTSSGAPTLVDLTAPNAGPVALASNIGIGVCLDSVIGTPAASQMVAAAGCPTGIGSNVWYGLGATDRAVAQSTGTSSLTARLVLGGRVTSAQAPTNYSGSVTFTVVGL
jgi:hypothetical protein